MVPGGSRPSDTDIRDLLAELFNLVYTVKNRFWGKYTLLIFWSQLYTFVTNAHCRALKYKQAFGEASFGEVS